MILFHGGGASAASWIIQAGSRNLAFTMVDVGYEVWLPNARGTTPSKNHTHLNADTDLAYWNFSSEEMALEDLPLYIDLILEETGTSKVYYSCHSMGCGIYLMGLSSIPELNNKIQAGFLLGPAGHAGSADNPLYLLLPYILGTPLESVLFRFLGGKMNGESSFLAKKLGLTFQNICTWSTMRCGICDNILFALYGADPSQLDYTGLPNLFEKLQDNLSLKVLYHYVQNNEACDFRRYDYGVKKDLIKYGTAEPPKFNLSRVAVPTYIFYGESDNLVTPWDAERTRDAIPANYMKGFFKVEWPSFNHIDFLMAKDADLLVYHKIRDIIQKLDGNEDVLRQHNIKRS